MTSDRRRISECEAATGHDGECRESGATESERGVVIVAVVVRKVLYGFIREGRHIRTDQASFNVLAVRLLRACVMVVTSDRELRNHERRQAKSRRPPPVKVH